MAAVLVALAEAPAQLAHELKKADLPSFVYLKPSKAWLYGA